MTKIYSEVSHNFETCNCEKCKAERKEEREMCRLFCYPVVSIAILLCLITPSSSTDASKA